MPGRMQDAMKKAGLDTGRPGRPNRRSGHGHPRGGPSQGPPAAFPNEYFTTDGEGRRCLRVEFVRKRLVDDWARHLANSRPNLTTGQVRRFFNHCRQIERRLNFDGESWERVSPIFEALSYHAQNAAAANKIPRDFQRFIDDNVKRVTSAPDPVAAFQEGFLLHFEALVGFGSAHLRKDS